jgi:hypothetical protein
MKLKISGTNTRYIFRMMLPAAFVFILSSCMQDREPTAPTPVTRPALTNNYQPGNGQLSVARNALLKIFFTNQMDVNTISDRLFLEDNNGNKIAGTYSSEGTAAVFTPSQPLNSSSIYKFSLKGRVRDIYGNSIYYNGGAVLNDTTVLLSGWFYTEGGYSEGGFNRVYAADKTKIFVIDSVNSPAGTIESAGIITGSSITGDGLYLLASIGSSNKVDFINLQTKQVETELTVSANPQMIAVHGNYAYVICVNGKAVEKINLSARTKEAAFAMDFFPGEIAVSNDGNRIYTIDQQKKDMVVIDASNGAVITRVAGVVTSFANGKLKADDNGRVFICDVKGNKLNVIDANNNLATAFEFSSGGPANVCFDNNYIYAAAGSSVYRLDKQSFAAGSSGIISFPVPVKSLTAVPSGDILYVITNTAAYIIDIGSFTVLAEIELASTALQEIICSPTKF